MKREESQNVEYKRSWHDEYLKWVCGFANAKGGTIWIGIDDDRSVYGVAGSKKLMEDIPNKIKDTMGLVDIYPDRLEIVSPGGMPDGSAVQDLDWRSVASDRRNPTLADMFAQMDYMGRKGSGLGLMLDAYAKEVPNPRQLEPKFYSSSGSFHVVLPNLNFNVTQGVTQDDTQGVPQGGTQDGTQGGTQGGIQELARDVVTRILGNPKITAKELSVALGVPLRTLRRHLAKLPNVRYVGHGYSGHWEVD